MNKPEDFEVIDAMRRYGGSFVRALAETAACADCNNLRRLKEAFPDYWKHYAEVAEKAAKEATAP